MYGTILCFDEQTEKDIYRIWDSLAGAEVSTYHIDKNGGQKRPHITMADYHWLDVECYKDSFKSFFGQRDSFNIDLSILGSFPGGGTLFLTPVMTNTLYQFHKSYHQAFAPFNDNNQSYYLPNRWVPHCTIANHLAPNKLTEAFDFVSQTFEPLNAKVSEVVLIRLIIEDGTVMGSETVLSHQI